MTEDPNKDLKWFLQLCDTFKYNRVTNNAIHLQLFPFSLIDNAFSWLDSQAPESITTWDELMEGESFQEDLEMFYNGLDARVRSGQDEAAGGELMNRTYKDVYEIIKNTKIAPVKAIQEDDKYQQLVDRLNHIESANNTLSMYGGDKPLFHYINNPVEDMNYIENRGGNPYSNTYNSG
ncbi:myb-like protein D [Gossypium australe]|uniref:Myb-like protein D n=1 Tax=Gossypium australe TaxID=47621 RepID=A0A5B6WY44_9ROSI|nr:myb-like protein D [Gossypium australe]